MLILDNLDQFLSDLKPLSHNLDNSWQTYLKLALITAATMWREKKKKEKFVQIINYIT